MALPAEPVRSSEMAPRDGSGDPNVPGGGPRRGSRPPRRGGRTGGAEVGVDGRAGGSGSHEEVMSTPRRRPGRPISGETASLWAGLWDLLRRTEPRSGCYDVEWDGPYYIPRPRQWHRSRFMLYGGTLFGSLEVGWSRLDAAWELTSGRLSYGAGARSTGDVAAVQAWYRAMPQLVRRLEAAVAHPGRYNRRVRRLLPLEARTGVVVRRWSWPRGTRAPLAPRELETLEGACRAGVRSEPLPSLTAAAYLALAGVAYDAAFPELRGLAPREQHATKADTRHGGLLDLAENDPAAFREWFASRAWSGSHPWEIVFGHPHGILLHPVPDDRGRWRLALGSDCPGLYLRAVRMAIALGERGIPFRLDGKEAVVAALRGLDDVEVGPGYGQLSLEEVCAQRPDAVARIRWDPVPEILPIAPPQRLRVEHVLATGTPSGWPQASEGSTGDQGPA